MRCLRRGDVSEVESNGRCGEATARGPRALCFRGGVCEAAGVRSGFDVSTLSDGVWRCSGATTTGFCMAVAAR